jgi:hypothetical protein
VARALDPAVEVISHEFLWVEGERICQAGAMGNIIAAGGEDTRTSAYSDLPAEEAKARRLADSVAAVAAQKSNADMFITERPFLYATSWFRGRGVAFCRPHEAVRLVSLYLRTCGTFLVRRTSGGPYTFDKGLFYWVAARAVLPSGWRWYSACVSSDVATQNDELTHLGATVFQRIARSLQAWDGLLRLFHRKQDANIAEDLAVALDTSLIFLMGALDACARVAHRVIGLPADEAYAAAWQKGRWLKKIAERAPRLREIVATGSVGNDVLTILRLLRNTVHGAGLDATIVSRAGAGLDEALVSLPRTDATEILCAIERQGGVDKWGLREVMPGIFHAEPATMMESLLPATVRLLDSLMEATPVELLDGVRAYEGRRAGRPGRDPFGEVQQQNVRWQLGI